MLRKVRVLFCLLFLYPMASGNPQAQVLEEGRPEELGFNLEKLERIEPVILQAMDDKEIPDAIDYLKYLYEIGVDGIIVQDIGFASLVRRIFPDLQVHASTQMTINNLEGAKHLEGLGFTRAVLAREVPLDEIERISKNCNIELEVFIHGALCFSYSGQCLMSSLIGGRSGNRGTCAQPCRMATI